MKLLVKYGVMAVVAMTLFCCNNADNSNTTNTEPIVAVAKTATSDPFKNTMPETQEFTIDTKQDNVIEGKNGTLVIMPKGCFVNSKGQIVVEQVKVELAEANTLEDMVLGNLTSTIDGKPMQTDGMLYINATTTGGEQLAINKDNPIELKMPTPRKVPGMMMYSGVRDSSGNMTWKDPVKPENYLVTVDLDKLDFLPEAFAPEVTIAIPFRGHKKADSNLNDSLYYSLSGRRAEDFQYYYDRPAPLNEPMINTVPTNSHDDYHDGATKVDTIKSTPCGIDPAIIKTIKTNKFENTLIATREFETRLQVIFKTCNKDVLELYIDNPQKNMYEVDSLAAVLLKGNNYATDFINFKKLHQGKVKIGDRHANILHDFYTKKLAEIKKKLNEAYTKYMAELKKKSDDFAKVDGEYRELLAKRERYRLETYDFKIIHLGWVSMITTLNWEPITVTVGVPNAKQFDRVYTYVIFTARRSLLRLNTTDSTSFYSGTIGSTYTQLMPIREKAIALTIGYKGYDVYFELTEFVTVTQKKLNITPTLSSKSAFKDLLKKYDSYLTENRLDVEVDYMAKYYVEQLRLKKLAKENEFMLKLWKIAYPCCDVPKVEFNG